MYGGFNYQISNFVIGVDGDCAGAGFHGRTFDVSAVNRDVANETSSTDWIATVTGRLGYTIGSDWLLFAKGGLAWSHFPATSVTTTPAGALVATTTSADTRDGWTVGAGVELRFLAHWSAKLEYDYLNLGNRFTTFSDVSNSGPLGLAQRLHLFEAGLNYHLGGMALGSWLVSRYGAQLRQLLWGYLLVEALLADPTQVPLTKVAPPAIDFSAPRFRPGMHWHCRSHRRPRDPATAGRAAAARGRSRRSRRSWAPRR